MTEILLTLAASTIVLTILAVIVQLVIIEPGFVHKVEFLIESKSFDEAETLIKAYLKKNNQDPIANYWLGEIYRQTGRKKDAAGIFETLLKKNFSRHKNYYKNMLFYLADFYREENIPDTAFNYIEQLIHMDSDSSDYYLLMSEILLQMQNPHQALVPLSKALALDNQNIKAWQLYADTNFDIENLQEAYTAYSYLIKLEPRDPATWYRLGETCEKKRENSKAIRFYLKAEQFKNPQIEFLAALKLGKLYKDQEEIYSAIQALEQGLTVARPEVASTSQILSMHYELAELYVAIQDFDKAIIQWEYIMHIDPNYLDVKRKLQEFSSIRLSDFFKDLLTKTDKALIETTHAFVKKFKYTIDNYKTLGQDIVTVTASETTGKWRDIKRAKTLFIFWCSSDPLPENAVLHALQTQKTDNFSRIIVISTGPVLSEVRNTLSRRSIDLYDKDNIQNLMQYST